MDKVRMLENRAWYGKKGYPVTVVKLITPTGESMSTFYKL